MAGHDMIQWLADLDKSALAVAGGKGANLGELLRAALPVPPGFVITTPAYVAFVAANQLQSQIVDLATRTRIDEPATFEAAAENIRALFLQGAIPADLAAAIAQAYARLTAGSDPAVAVRSSATAEDLPSASFAGQQDTFLNVRGEGALLEAVRQCWASLWTARAISYRLRQDIDPATVSQAVIVQQLIPADASGILFTANPVNGQRAQILINATWGLGEAIVGGQVTPDSTVVDKSDWQIRSRATATKTVMTVRTDTGTAEVPVPQPEQNQPVLDDGIALELAHYGARIEAHFGLPMDVEWAVAGGKIAILQARPITSLPAPQLEPPTAWTVPDPEGFYYRSSIVELLPNPLSPLFAGLCRPAIAEATNDILQLVMGFDERAEDWLDFPTINGYGYYHMRNMGRVLFGSITSISSLFRALYGMFAGDLVDVIWRQEYHPRYAGLVRQWQEKSIGALPAGELVAGIKELLAEGTRYYTSVQAVMPTAMMSESALTSFYDRFVKREDDPPIVTFMLGFDSLPIQAEQSLYDLALWSQEHATLAQALAATSAAQLAELYGNGQPLKGAEPAEWDEWRSRFHTHLDHYGHMIYDLDFVNAVPNDDPAPLIETLKYHMQGQSVDPHRRQAESVARREAATQATLARLDPIRRRMFRKLLHWAQSTAPAREDALADLGLAWPLMRQMAFELGRRLAAAGAVEQAGDVFWLEAGELQRAATQLDAGETDLGDFTDRIGQRRALMAAQRRVTPPSILPKGARFFGFDFEKYMPAKAAETQTGTTIEGVGASPGQVTATARVLRGPEDFGKMQPGDILVAGITTPAWTPLFAMASAVVTDVGGPLSHGSIVAREYRIPAVLGTGIATKRIQSGQRLHVDGSAGRVTMMDETDTAETGAAHVLPSPPSAADRTTTSRRQRNTLLVLAAGFVVALAVWWRRRS